MKKQTIGIAVICIVAISILFLGSTKKNKPFAIIAMGDMPYFLPQDYTRFENLISYLNKQDQVFNVFVGDIKSSRTNCTNEIYDTMFHYFETFKLPLIYTPGDNEWTDCISASKDTLFPLQRLDYLRKVFYSNSLSLGQNKIRLVSQSDQLHYKKYIENKQWNYQGVSFATIHVVGSNNNFDTGYMKSNTEFKERSKANLFWLNSAFKNATINNSLGLILFIHADMFEIQANEGFEAFLKALKTLTIEYSKPVLLVHGDSHKFVLDKPFYTDSTHTKVLQNFTRVQVFGEYDMHAVKIVCNPNNPGLFEIQTLIVPNN